ncbi:MAG: hypothetical protein PHY59_01170 [Methanobacterium sp.]|nr:hypothetical protein [Methanobacterium sp.]
MDRDYKLIGVLIPIILVLSLVLYIFPGYSNIDIASPIINQTNQSTNGSLINTSLLDHNKQISQGKYPTNPKKPIDNSNTTSDITNNTDKPKVPDEPIGPSNCLDNI